MQLVYENTRKRFEAITRYGETTAPKDAGMRWDPTAKRWHTTDAKRANLLRAAADAVAVARLDAELAVADVAATAKKVADVAAIELSRATDATVELPVNAGMSYLGYQKAGIIYANKRTDTLIADEPGLGKTVQALGLANLMMKNAGKARLSILVVGPKISLWNWRKEAEKWLTSPHTSALWTSKSQADADLVIVNYDVLSRPSVAAALRARTWDLAVFDEAHALKNGKAARTKAVLGDYATRTPAIAATKRLFLTGTPILNRPIELYPVLHAMRVEQAKDFYQFAGRYCAGHHSGYGYDATGASNLPELQSVLRASVMVRRLKADVLTELPAKRYSVVELEADTPEMRRAITAERVATDKNEVERKRLRAAVAKAKRAGDKAAHRSAVEALAEGERVAMTEMSRLRHDTAVAKVPQVVEHVVALLEGSDESLLVMAHHRDVIAAIVAGVEQAGYPAAVITGSTSDVARQAAQDDIQSKRKRVFVGSMRACGVSITLTAASTVVFAEQDWTPGIMSQAEDRAHRIGQDSSVLVQHLVVDGSFDSAMAKSVASKGGVIDSALDDVEDNDVRAARKEKSAADKAALEDEVVAAVARAAEEYARAEAVKFERLNATVLRHGGPHLEQRIRERMTPDRVAERRAEAVARFEARATKADTGSVLDGDQVDAIRRALRLIADVDGDRASEKNDVGFSQSDTTAGHMLSDMPTLTSAQALLGLELVRRYHRQLPEDLFESATRAE